MGDKNFYYCNGCNSSKVSAVSIPYAFKLLMQELESVNIGMRIKTENSEYTDNIV
jgi:DNA-directed RNA polymerase beta subunit